jgi:hypothetical protein
MGWTAHTKKSRRGRTPEVFDHVGLLVNGAPGTDRVTLHLVFRRLRTRILLLEELYLFTTGNANELLLYA